MTPGFFIFIFSFPSPEGWGGSVISRASFCLTHQENECSIHNTRLLSHRKRKKKDDKSEVQYKRVRFSIFISSSSYIYIYMNLSIYIHNTNLFFIFVHYHTFPSRKKFARRWHKLFVFFVVIFPCFSVVISFPSFFLSFLSFGGRYVFFLKNSLHKQKKGKLVIFKRRRVKIKHTLELTNDNKKGGLQQEGQQMVKIVWFSKRWD